MRNLRDRPIRQKITLVIMMIASAVLLLAFAALFCFQAYTLKQHSAHELAVVGEITAHNCAAAVMFKDEDAAAQILGGLRTMPQIVSARLELADQQQLAFFGAARDETEIKAARLKSGFRIDGDRILLAQPVMLSGAREGTLYLLADLHATTSQLLKLYGGIFSLVLVASLLVAFILSSQFLHIVTTPILRLAGTARTIADHNDYSVRATKVCGDEVGVLTDAFNQMLAQIQSQDTALRKAEEKYRLIFENAIDGIFQTTPEGRYISVNPALARMCGYGSPEELVASVSDIARVEYVDPERRAEFKRLIEAQGFVDGFECEVYRKDGSRMWLLENAHAVRDASGVVIYYEGTVQDITERKQTEEALRKSENKLAQAQAIAHLGYWERDLDTDRIMWSNETYRVFGLSPQESVNNFARFQELIYPEDRQLVMQAIGEALQGGPRYDMEYRVVRPGGEVRFVHTQGDVILDESSQPRRMFGTVQDITERKQAEEALREAEQKYRAIFENAIEGIFQTTPDGRYISVNPALARMYGYDSPEELIASVTDISRTIYVDPNRRNEFKRLIEVQGLVELFEYEVYRKDGSKIWLCENARAVRDATGATLYYEGTVEDVTERKLVDEVKRASKAKSEFLSRMSHELRTPLNAILGFGQLLERQKPTEVQRKRIRYILSAGKHLLDLINEVLDISRIEAGRMQLSLEPVCVADALEETLDLMRPLATERTIQLAASADIDAGVHVLADRQRFKQVLLNLLNNAVKYTPFFGGVTVSYHVTGNEKVRVLVSDTGPGIPAEKLARLFTPFERLGAEQSVIEGTGLGLALSQRLMQGMGGSIGVESAVGKGSTFWIELSLTKSPIERLPREREANGARQPSSEPASRSILYIEDNLSNLALIEQMLAERPETALLTTMQGKVGLDLARQHSPDLILLDLHLPDLPGWDVLLQLKVDSTTRHIPVVVISADATKRQINRLMSAGAAHYLTKPLDVNKFFRVLDETSGIDNAEQSPAAAMSNGDVKEACPSP
jgi:PAS domain S-box-containing protein